MKSQPNPKYTIISLDNQSGARAAVEDLLSLAMPKMGLIIGSPGWPETRQTGLTTLPAEPVIKASTPIMEYANL